jgi:enoyl-CoA hydratase
MTYTTITYEKKKDRVAVITLNRPDKFNTIKPPMPDEIEAAMSEANRDKEVRVILLQGPASPSVVASTSPMVSSISMVGGCR